MEQREAHRRLLGIPGSGKEFFYIYIFSLQRRKFLGIILTLLT